MGCGDKRRNVDGPNSQVIEISTGQRVGPFALSMPVKIPNQINIPPRRNE